MMENGTDEHLASFYCPGAHLIKHLTKALKQKHGTMRQMNKTSAEVHAAC
jgi:hypothetical protein